MIIEGKITLLFSKNGLSLEIADKNAAIKFLELELPPLETCQVLSRLSCVPCSLEITDLDKIGKKMEHTKFTFEMEDSGYTDTDMEERAYKKALEVCPKGWQPDNSFNSQSSFSRKEGKLYATCTIRKWE